MTRRLTRADRERIKAEVKALNKEPRREPVFETPHCPDCQATLLGGATVHRESCKAGLDPEPPSSL